MAGLTFVFEAEAFVEMAKLDVPVRLPINHVEALLKVVVEPHSVVDMRQFAVRERRELDFPEELKDAFYLGLTNFRLYQIDHVPSFVEKGKGIESYREKFGVRTSDRRPHIIATSGRSGRVSSTCRSFLTTYVTRWPLTPSPSTKGRSLSDSRSTTPRSSEHLQNLSQFGSLKIF